MNTILKIGGFILIAIGSIGLFLPFIQGLFLIAVGVYFISRVDKEFEQSVIKFIEKGKNKFPRYKKYFESIERIYIKLVKWGKKEKGSEQEEKTETQQENKEL